MGAGKVNRRHSQFRRDLNDLIRSPDGKVSEAKVWVNTGKAICVYLLLAYTQTVMETEWSLVTLLSFIIAPELVKKALVLRTQQTTK